MKTVAVNKCLFDLSQWDSIQLLMQISLLQQIWILIPTGPRLATRPLTRLLLFRDGHGSGDGFFVSHKYSNYPGAPEILLWLWKTLWLESSSYSGSCYIIGASLHFEPEIQIRRRLIIESPLFLWRCEREQNERECPSWEERRRFPLNRIRCSPGPSYFWPTKGKSL